MIKKLQLALPSIDLDNFFEDILISENIFDHFQPVVPKENTDDHPVLEFMVVRDYQLGTMGSDPFADNQSELNIDPVRHHQLKDPARFAHRAAVFWRLGTSYLESFNNVLMNDANVAAEFFLLSAEQKLLEDKPDVAVTHLSTAIKIRPAFAEAHNSLAAVLESQDKISEAIEHYQKAVEIDPNFAEAHNNLGRALGSQGKLTEAIEHFNIAIKNQPNLFKAYNNLGNALASQDEIDEAIKTFHKALTYNQHSGAKENMADIHHSLAMVLKKSGRLQQALQEFHNAADAYQSEITEKPNSVKPVSMLARVLVELGNLNEAQKYLHQAVEMEPDNLENHLLLVQTFVFQKRYNKATQHLNDTIRFMLDKNQNQSAAKLQEYLKFIKAKQNEQVTE